MTASGCEVDEVTFVEDPLDINHECLVCLQLLREPWIVECCGYHLCKPCIDKLIRDRKGCPHCRTSRFRHMRDRNHERILLGKQVYCKYRRKGCKWQGTLREFNQHGSTILNCKWCRKRLQCYEEQQHQQVCTVAVEVIACELQPFGCRQKLPRMNMSQHMQDYCSEHVKLLKQANEQSSSEVNRLTNEIDLLEKDRMGMEKKYQQSSSEVNRLTNKVDLLEKDRMGMEKKYQQSSSEVNRLTNEVDLLEKDRMGMEKKYQTLRTRFDQIKMEVNNIHNEKAQSLRVQSLHYKCAIGLSIILGLLFGVLLQYLYPVIFVKLVLPAVVLSILFLSICACYVCLSSLLKYNM